MQARRYIQLFFQTLYSLPSLTFIVILMVSVVGCNMPSMQSTSEPKLSDKNARMYQMYFDSSADPAKNELQTRRFIGHLHLADLETIFGDIQSLPMDENCNYIGGPVLDEEGTSWYATITPDLVGVNLVSVTPDGTRSSAFDLDGDRVVDILDMRFSDNRRVSMVTELMGLEVFREWLQGRDPFCNTEVARQLGLPDLGCDERGDGSSGGGGGGFGQGSGITDPVDMICLEYDTGPMAGLLDRATRGQDSGRIYQTSRHTEVNFDSDGSGIYRYVETYITRDANTGEILRIQKTIVDVYANGDEAYGHVVQTVHETVDADGIGTRTTQRYQPNGMPDGSAENDDFLVNTDDMDETGYDEEDSYPPPEGPNFDSSQVTSPELEGDPGPEGSDLAIAEFCRNRANHRSGIEQATEQDPTSVSLSCNDLVGAPSNGNCNIIEWARTDDFRGILNPPPDDEGCAFEDPDRRCEGDSIDDQIRRFVGLNAELWSLNLPENNLCPPFLCDPAQSIELQTYTAGGIEFTCNPVITETLTLEPSEENCPPGTYYAPMTNRCIAIQISQGGGNGGSEGGGGSCNLSTSACTAQGLSFDSNKCECVPLQ